nr:CBM_HP1_G0001050.mRNA.1.CDS.1 [Saccharomyces cerevisiae]
MKSETHLLRRYIQETIRGSGSELNTGLLKSTVPWSLTASSYSVPPTKTFNEEFYNAASHEIGI